jgi:hypothetical protein
MFMLTMAGVDLGYRYSWYLRGPYCPALTFDAFALDAAQKITPGTPSEALPAEIQRGIGGVKQSFGDVWADPTHLELLSSILFIARSTDEQDESAIWGRLQKLKPERFAQEAFNRSLQRLKSEGYLDA